MPDLIAGLFAGVAVALPFEVLPDREGTGASRLEGSVKYCYLLAKNLHSAVWGAALCAGVKTAEAQSVAAQAKTAEVKSVAAGARSEALLDAAAAADIAE